MTRGRLVTFAALVAALAWALMTVGAYVRVSDSGLGCPDWPACHGQLVAGGHHALIEQVHRWIVTVLSVALVVLAALVYRLRRGERRVTTAMTITLALLGLQVVLGGVTVLLNNVSWTVVLHYGAAAALLAAVLLVVVRLAFPEAESPPRDAYVRLVTWLAGITFGLLLVGATVATTDSHESCGKSFPLCKGSVAPSIDHHVVIHMTHRIWAGVALILALWTWRQTGRLPAAWRASSWHRRRSEWPSSRPARTTPSRCCTRRSPRSRGFRSLRSSGWRGRSRLPSSHGRATPRIAAGGARRSPTT